MQPVHSRPAIWVLIATQNRPSSLARALRSVAAQTRLPDHVVVVDDSDPGAQSEVEEIVMAMEVDRLHCHYMRNHRTRPRAAGAWNTGIDFIRRQIADPSSVYVAVLDDDDWWEHAHLAECEHAVATRNLDMVAAGISRYDTDHPNGLKLTIPRNLVMDELLVGGVHIQGSNLFVRLDRLLEAGMFDEGLASTTDRDLAIRLADLSDLRFGSIEAYTVHHDARPTGRLSDPGSPRRSEGLQAFWNKFRGRMSPDVERRFLDRALRCFKWRPEEGPAVRVGRKPAASPSASVALVVGITVDPARVDRVDGLLADLRQFSSDPECVGLDVVLLENGECAGLRELVQRYLAAGLRCYFVSLEQQQRDFDRGSGREPIGRTRLMLQSYVHRVMQWRPYSIAWIIDDDMRLEALVTRGGTPRRERAIRLRDLAELRRQGVDVVLGTETDAPPVPAAGIMRVQAVDLVHNLHWLARLRPDEPLPDRFAENLKVMRRCRDYHYDLARGETHHLETPFWLTPSRDGETVVEAFERLASRLPDILSGQQIFRPIVLDLESPPPVQDAINRGGNAFIFNPDVLIDIPNAVPRIAGQEVRRSEMVWCLLNKHFRGRKIVRAPLPLRQDRTGQKANALNDRLAGDLRGFALYSALDALLKQRAEGKGMELDKLDFQESEVDFALGRYKKFVRERLAALESGIHRIRGAANSARAALRAPKAWWGECPRGLAAVAEILKFLDALQEEFGPEKVSGFRAKVLALEEETLREYLAKLPSMLHPRLPAGDQAFLNAQRGAVARAQVERMMEVAGLHELGRGAESVVFTDGKRVFKYFDFWKPRDPAAQRAFLRSLVGRWPEAKGLYPILDWKEEGPHAVLTYPYEPAEPYRDGQGPGFVRLLRECRQYGIVCRNIHPQNLIVSATGLRLVDYGADICSWSEEEWLHMCRRAWLSWRWSWRPDLKNLMMRALTDTSLPELDGFERFLAAMGDSPALNDLDRLVEGEAVA